MNKALRPDPETESNRPCSNGRQSENKVRRASADAGTGIAVDPTAAGVSGGNDALGDVADTDEAGVTSRNFVAGACLLVDVSGAMADDDVSVSRCSCNEGGESCSDEDAFSHGWLRKVGVVPSDAPTIRALTGFSDPLESG